MTPEEQKLIEKNLEEVASILYKYTSAEELSDLIKKWDAPGFVWA